MVSTSQLYYNKWILKRKLSSEKDEINVDKDKADNLTGQTSFKKIKQKTLSSILLLPVYPYANSHRPLNLTDFSPIDQHLKPFSQTSFYLLSYFENVENFAYIIF